jgi:hypothetical protein
MNANLAHLVFGGVGVLHAEPSLSASERKRDHLAAHAELLRRGHRLHGFGLQLIESSHGGA